MPTVELTDRFCQSAKAVDGKQTDYFDTAVRGLCLRISPGGTKTWNLVYTSPASSKRARMKLARYPETTLGKAREKARASRGKIAEGIDPQEERRAQSALLSVADLVDSYCMRHASTKRSGPAIERRLVKNVSGVIGTIKLADLHRRDLTRCIDTVKDRGAPIEANRLFEDIRAMVRWAKGRGDLDDNLVEGMRRPSEMTPRKRFLSSDEIKQAWHALPNVNMRESTRRILRLCLITGQRVGEVAGMQREDIDLKSETWNIPASETKNGRPHSVPLSAMALAIIRDQIEDVNALAARKDRAVPRWVFPGPGQRAPVTPGSIPKALKRLESPKGTILGVPPFTPHDLRRTAATHMEANGISPYIVGHVLNHVSVTAASITSRVYARYTYEKEKREALDTWAAVLAGILEGRDNVVSLAGAS